METLDNPVGYTIAPIYLDENADWDKLFAGCNGEERREVVATSKRFIRQVLEGRGYDVDCFPTWTFMSPFIPLLDFKLLKPMYAKIRRAGEFAVWKLNAALAPSTTSRYKLVDVDKAVTEESWKLLLLTFTAKEVHASDLEDEHKLKVKFRDGCFDLWGSDRIRRGEEYTDSGDSEFEDTSSDSSSDDGDAPIITCQATVVIYPNRAEGKDYEVTELRVKTSDATGYQQVIPNV